MTYVYFAECPELHMLKIGYSAHPDRRVKDLYKTLPPVRWGEQPEVHLLHTIPTQERRLESALHYYFHHHCVHGKEWLCSDAVKDAAMALTEANFPDILHEYWVSYPRSARPVEYREPKRSVGPLRAFTSTPCYFHPACAIDMIRKRAQELHAVDPNRDHMVLLELQTGLRQLQIEGGRLKVDWDSF